MPKAKKSISLRRVTGLLSKLHACPMALNWVTSTASVRDAWRNAQLDYLLWLTHQLKLDISSIVKEMISKARKVVLAKLEKKPALRKYRR